MHMEKNYNKKSKKKTMNKDALEVNQLSPKQSITQWFLYHISCGNHLLQQLKCNQDIFISRKLLHSCILFIFCIMQYDYSHEKQ